VRIEEAAQAKLAAARECIERKRKVKEEEAQKPRKPGRLRKKRHRK